MHGYDWYPDLEQEPIEDLSYPEAILLLIILGLVAIPVLIYDWIRKLVGHARNSRRIRVS